MLWRILAMRLMTVPLGLKSRYRQISRPLSLLLFRMDRMKQRILGSQFKPGGEVQEKHRTSIAILLQRQLLH